MRTGLLKLTLWLCCAPFASAQTKPVDFAREIRPIISDNCFACHGPDPTTRMAGLRLDRKETVLEVRKRGAAVVPGKSEESLLYKRISEKIAGKRMPPEYSHKTLTAQQIALLKRWIDQGANWQEHWAFKAPISRSAGPVRNAAWVQNPIDRFILAKLEEKNLTPAPVANRRVLIRRVALDVTGLPPKPSEIEIFLKDTAPGAYERMLDRYLASPHYGEHRGRYWLDAARYGDTHGLHFDNYREMWPYRDWVIQAFNKNTPFDQFTIEQLAGDLLPNPTLDQRIATGFQRCNVTTNEAGIIEDEYKEIYAKDRADTTGAVWLGLTVGCATCHDHKFDPILQKDFYALGAFFRNTSQKVMDGNIADPMPVLVVPRQEDRAKLEKTNARLRAIGKEMVSAREAAADPFQRWLRERVKITAVHPFEKADELFQLAKNATSPVKDAPKLDAGKPFSINVEFLFPKTGKNHVIAAHQNAKDKNRGWVLDTTAQAVGLRLIGDNGKAIEVRAAMHEQLEPGNSYQVTVSYDGSRNQAGLSLYVNGRAVATQARGNVSPELPGSISVDDPLTLGKTPGEGVVRDLRIFNRTLNMSEAALLNEWPKIEPALMKASGDLDAADKKALLSYYLARHDDKYRGLAAEQDTLSQEAAAIARRGAVTHVMQELVDSKPIAHLLHRGAYDQKRDLVEANTPSVLPPMTSDLPKNRLGFAKWLFSAEHPLTARVTVNRMWQEIFGNGIVKTADDFGSQGEPPTHPELLDWLAVDFRAHNWDVKRFYKQVLMSATYRQAALLTPEKLAKDPENRLMSRGPRFRMDAEVVRDYALAASGLLAPQIGGPSAKPYQPDGVWDAVAMLGSNTRFYKADTGDGLYRRSVYTFWKRAAPPASMDIFNGPSRESCVVRRERTNTPLQALVTMNDVQFVETARVLASNALQSVAEFDARLDFLSTRVLARTLSVQERRIARKVFDDFQTYYKAHVDDANKLLALGERKADPGLSAAEYAAFTMLTNQLLNLDEVLNK